MNNIWKELKNGNFVPLDGIISDDNRLILEVEGVRYYTELTYNNFEFKKYQMVLMSNKSFHKLERLKEMLFCEDLSSRNKNILIINFIRTIKPIAMIGISTKEVKLLKLIVKKGICLEYLKAKNGVKIFDPDDRISEREARAFLKSIIKKEHFCVLAEVK